MTTTLAPDVTEVADLEALFGELAPCDWKRGHQATGTPCTEVATVLMWQGCMPDTRWRACAEAVIWAEAIMALNLPCGHCRTSVRDCWRVIPI